ncbi:MAG TPA: Swt1 family HEPN domain-containing protein [Gemmatimonadaceae bacterium]|nr:Swt1 family HEPN domain-containing protein [Gemmatimonadaceae bacterium]
MDSPERQSVRRALDALKPFLEAFLHKQGVRPAPAIGGHAGSTPDIQALLRACLHAWDAVLQHQLPRVARTYIHEILDVRNRWAHEAPFTAAEAARAADTARVFAVLIGAPEQPATIPATAPAPRPAPGKRRESQREIMARIFVAAGRDEERAIREYAAAELRGEVVRKSNKHGLDAESYARALLNDGLKKGWLP